MFTAGKPGTTPRVSAREAQRDARIERYYHEIGHAEFMRRSDKIKAQRVSSVSLATVASTDGTAGTDGTERDEDTDSSPSSGDDDEDGEHVMAAASRAAAERLGIQSTIDDLVDGAPVVSDTTMARVRDALRGGLVGGAA